MKGERQCLQQGSQTRSPQATCLLRVITLYSGKLKRRDCSRAFFFVRHPTWYWNKTAEHRIYISHRRADLSHSEVKYRHVSLILTPNQIPFRNYSYIRYGKYVLSNCNVRWPKVLNCTNQLTTKGRGDDTLECKQPTEVYFLEHTDFYATAQCHHACTNNQLLRKASSLLHQLTHGGDIVLTPPTPCFYLLYCPGLCGTKFRHCGPLADVSLRPLA